MYTYTHLFLLIHNFTYIGCSFTQSLLITLYKLSISYQYIFTQLEISLHFILERGLSFRQLKE